MNEFDEKSIFDAVLSDDDEFLKRAIAENPNVKAYKFGNMPIVSIAILFNSEKTVRLFLPFYKETNAFYEHDEPAILAEKRKEALNDEIFESANFIEPVEVAYYTLSPQDASDILKNTVIKTISARKRIESRLNPDGDVRLVRKGDDLFLRKKSKIGKKRFRVLAITTIIACIIIVIVPIIALSCLKVTVEYYDGVKYGTEEGACGRDITIESPTREGYTFLGWFVDKELKISANGKLPSKAGKYVYYAGWKINEYEIVFDITEFDVENEFELINKGKYLTKLIMPVPKVSGKLFVGWFDSDGNLVKDNYYRKNLVLKPEFVDFDDNSFDNPYEITDQNQMPFLSEQSGYFTFADGLVFDENYVSLGAYTSYSVGFQGVLLGLGRKITIKGAKMPVFLTIGKDASVRDLTIEYVKNVNLDDYEYDKYGALVAMNLGSIQNVDVAYRPADELGRVVVVDSKKLITSVGGLVGSNSGEITDCSVDGKWQTDILSPCPSVNYTGGIAGSNSGTIENCISFIIAECHVWNGGYGGIVGYNVGNVNFCKNLSSISVKGVTNTTETSILDSLVCQSGGITASNSISLQNGQTKVGSIENCSNNGSIDFSTSSMTGYLGGIAGFGGGDVIGCTNERNGEIVVKNTEYLCYVGGIVGFATHGTQGKIEACVNRATVDANRKGYAYVGGIVGQGVAEKIDDKLIIDSSDNYGVVKGGCYTGGIAGNVIYTQIGKCVSYGQIVIDSVGDFTLVSGGIAGCAIGSAVSSSVFKGSIENKSEVSTVYVGGIVGEFVDSYCNSAVYVGQISGKDVDVCGLLFAVINLSNGISRIETSYALSDGQSPVYNDYNSSTDSDGNLIYHDPDDINKPLLLPSDKGEIFAIEDLTKKGLIDVTVDGDEVVVIR